MWKPYERHQCGPYVTVVPRISRLLSLRCWSCGEDHEDENSLCAGTHIAHGVKSQILGRLRYLLTNFGDFCFCYMWRANSEVYAICHSCVPLVPHFSFTANFLWAHFNTSLAPGTYRSWRICRVLPPEFLLLGVIIAHCWVPELTSLIILAIS